VGPAPPFDNAYQIVWIGNFPASSAALILLIAARSAASLPGFAW
jgi:hypothetical protein